MSPKKRANKSFFLKLIIRTSRLLKQIKKEIRLLKTDKINLMIALILPPLIIWLFAAMSNASTSKIIPEKVIVVIITLDSEGCAPCQYMVEAVKSVAPQFSDLVIWREHKIKEKESVEFMMGLMVKNIPTICIDGQIRFVSTIPAREELIAAIQERINEKFFLKLRQHHNRLLILGADCESSESTRLNVDQAVKELGSTIEIVNIWDEQKIQEYGIASTPAILTVREQVKSVGRVPSVEVIKEWLKDLE